MQVHALQTEGRVIIPRCRVARDFFSRFLGLMGRKRIAADEALLFPKCNSIHTFFMRMSIDIVFTDAAGTVIEVIEALPPWRLLMPRRKVTHTVEIGAQRARELGIRPGTRLACEGVWA